MHGFCDNSAQPHLFWRFKLLLQTLCWKKKKKKKKGDLNHFYLIDAVRFLSLNHFKIRVNPGFIIACYINNAILNKFISLK